MKKNLYYRTVYKRTNGLKELALSFFLGLSSFPRLLLEVFIRRNFGERYFSFSGAILLTVVLAIYPVMQASGLYVVSRYQNGVGSFDLFPFLGRYFSWYGFLCAYFVTVLERRSEVKRLPSVFDFARFSLSSGTIARGFYSIDLFGRRGDIRTIETVLEPGLFFLIGLLLALMMQPIGVVILICSIFYSLSYVAAYYQGDQFVMDKIDEMICSEEMVKSFVEGRTSDETRGFQFYGRRPTDPDTRQRVVDSFMAEETVIAM